MKHPNMVLWTICFVKMHLAWLFVGVFHEAFPLHGSWEEGALVLGVFL